MRLLLEHRIIGSRWNEEDILLASDGAPSDTFGNAVDFQAFLGSKLDATGNAGYVIQG